MTRVQKHARKGTKGVRSHNRSTGTGRVPPTNYIEETLEDAVKRLPKSYKVIEKELSIMENNVIKFTAKGGWKAVTKRINKIYGHQARNIRRMGEDTYIVVLSPLKRIN